MIQHVRFFIFLFLISPSILHGQISVGQELAWPAVWSQTTFLNDRRFLTDGALCVVSIDDLPKYQLGRKLRLICGKPYICLRKIGGTARNYIFTDDPKFACDRKRFFDARKDPVLWMPKKLVHDRAFVVCDSCEEEVSAHAKTPTSSSFPPLPSCIERPKTCEPNIEERRVEQERAQIETITKRLKELGFDRRLFTLVHNQNE